ncbi:MAG: methionyl-tRNA formyltransferase [Flavobacteriales bacterium]|nr:methionyl-tRNA formyltransferase [Flavobacteriales bacterium]
MERNEMRVVLIGTPDFSVPSFQKIVDAGYQVVGVITSVDKPAGRGMNMQKSAVKQFAEKNNLHILQPTNLKNPEFIAELAQLKADLQVVIAFRMLPEMVWNMPRLGTVNLHASLLPNYRGAAPINWSIMNGEIETGLSTFRLKHEIDTGDILMQKKLDIQPNENAGQLHDRMMLAGADLMLETLDGIRLNTLTAIAQVFSKNDKIAPKIFKEHCQIDWKNNGSNIYNQIRGLSPYPVARTFLDSKILKVYDANFTRENHDRYPGVFETDGKSYLHFFCSDGIVSLTDVQIEGKRRMKIDEFLRGFRMD